jgi:hypothetical protein
MVYMVSTIFVTALLSSILTLGLAYFLYQRRLKNDLEARLNELSGEFKERVRQGVIEAGMELLPKFRAEVREGFKEAISDTVKSNIIEKTAKSMADIGGALMDTSLKTLFGTKG